MKKGIWKERTINVPHYILECPYCEFTIDLNNLQELGRWVPLFCGGCGARLSMQEDLDELEDVEEKKEGGEE